MTKTRSQRVKENSGGKYTISFSTDGPGTLLLAGIFISTAIFLLSWLFGWNNSITRVVLINGIDMSQVTWINVLIDPVAQGAAYLNNQVLFFSTMGILSIIILMAFLIPAVLLKLKLK